MVSFIHLPAYIEDSEILNKLENWGVTPASEIRRESVSGHRHRGWYKVPKGEIP